MRHMDMPALIARLGGLRPLGGSVLMPMTEAEIVAFEKQLGVRLPEAYRVLLGSYGASAFNGASPDHSLIVFRPIKPFPSHFKSGKGPFAVFFGKDRHEHDTYGLRECFKVFSGRMPESIIPIGDD